MSRPDYSAKAYDDLRDILAYVARDKPRAAVQLIDKIKQRCSSIAKSPYSGTMRDELSPGLRCVVVGNYVIYFTSTNERVRIERVLHAARDVDALF